MKNFLNMSILIGWEKIYPSIFIRINTSPDSTFLIMNDSYQLGANFPLASSCIGRIRFKTLVVYSWPVLCANITTLTEIKQQSNLSNLKDVQPNWKIQARHALSNILIQKTTSLLRNHHQIPNQLALIDLLYTTKMALPRILLTSMVQRLGRVQDNSVESLSERSSPIRYRNEMTPR